MHNVEEILKQCTNILHGGSGRTMKEQFQALADSLAGNEYQDNYGSGSYIADFEAEIATLFGKEAAVFMPTGTMAQQIALRIWCEQRNNFTVAMHPTAHLEFAEHLGYQYLHHIRRLSFGAPERLRDRMLTVADFEILGQKPGAVLLELPYHLLYGQLPHWDELLAIKAWLKERAIPFHLDGARIWQCRPFYQKQYHEIADLFDSLYVSFYKDIGSLAGAMLIGPASFIEEARIWRIRHGGRLRTMSPFVVSAKLGIKRVLPQIDTWVMRAQELAAILSEFEPITIEPDPPHVNFFAVYIKGDPEALTSKHMEAARQTGTFLTPEIWASPVAGVSMTNMRVGEAQMKFDVEALQPFVEKWLA
jgi:threonine aldolase